MFNGVLGCEHHTILIEEEYGYRYWVWYFQGTIEECVFLFKQMRPDSCTVSVEKLNIDEYSIVREVTYEEWAGIFDAEQSNGYAHWHEPTDSKLNIKDECGAVTYWCDEDAIQAQIDSEDEIDEEVLDFLNNHGQGTDQAYEDYYPNQEESEYFRDSPDGTV